jgi:hypothetical protein
MKKILLLTAVAALFTGCDSAGYEGPPIVFSNVTVTELGAGLTAPVIEIQDIASRSYFRADITTGVPLGGFEITAGDRNLYVVVLDGEEFVGASGSFRPAELTEDPTFEVRAPGGQTVVARALLDVQL